MKNNDTINLEKNFFFQNTTNNTIKRSTNHYHNTYEIYYLTNGKCWYFIDKKSYLLSEGDIALIPKNVIHKTSYETSSHSRILINCSENFIPKSVLDIFPKIPYYTIPLQYRDKMNDIFNVIQTNFHAPNIFSEDLIKAKIYELLLLIASNHSYTQIEKAESLIVENTVKYIHQHFSENISLYDISECCGVSREHVSRTFKKETGLGVNEYLTIYRLKQADTFLRNDPKAKISEVSLRCGFNDSNYFTKLYKKTFNISPTQAKKL